jgi:hypothetical protein
MGVLRAHKNVLKGMGTAIKQREFDNRRLKQFFGMLGAVHPTYTPLETGVNVNSTAQFCGRVAPTKLSCLGY